MNNCLLLMLCAMVASGAQLPEQQVSEEYRKNLMSEMAFRPAKGNVAIVDCQSGFDVERTKDFFFPKGQCMKIPFFHYKESAPFDISKASNWLRDHKADSAIFIVSSPSLPMSLTAPEAKWSLVNYAALTTDRPNDKRMMRRMDKMFSRAVIQLLGGGSFMGFKNSATKRVNSIADLDRLEGVSPAPEAMISMDRYMYELGFRDAVAAPYYVACQEGWAPAPTNDTQRFLWKIIHETPTKPIKITYDKDKQKPVVK